VQWALLPREVGAREDGHAVEPVRSPRARPAFCWERGAPVGPDSRLDSVEDVRDAHGIAASDDLDLDGGQCGLIRDEPLDPAAVDRKQVGGE
jgi:hypothetical protein